MVPDYLDFLYLALDYRSNIINCDYALQNRF